MSKTNADRARLTQNAATASVAVALILLVLKSWAAMRTGSVSMLGSLADTGLDVIASLVTLFSVRLAARPADPEHRFGHGKAESLAALFQAGIITASAVAIGWRGLSRIGGEMAPVNPELGIGVSLVSVAATAALVLYQRRVVAWTGSNAIAADRIHYTSDLLLNASVIVALVLDSILNVRGADPAFGVIIALWLLWHVREVAARAIEELMDREWPEDRRQRFLDVAKHPAIIDIHDLRTRSSGARDFAQFHIWLDPVMNLTEAHRVMDEVEAKLSRAFPGVEVQIHPEPDGYRAGHALPHERPEQG